MKHNLATLKKVSWVIADVIKEWKSHSNAEIDEFWKKVAVVYWSDIEDVEKELREMTIPDAKVRELLKEADERKDWKRFAEILIAASMSSRIQIKEILGEASSGAVECKQKEK